MLALSALAERGVAPKLGAPPFDASLVTPAAAPDVARAAAATAASSHGVDAMRHSQAEPAAKPKPKPKPTRKRAVRRPAKHSAKHPAQTRRRPAPRSAVNPSHYIRSLRGNGHDLAIMRTLGAQDAQRNPSNKQHVVLLDIGGQVPGGVFLSTTHRFISYAALTRAVNAYVSGYHQRQHANAPVVIALGTNNDLFVSAARGRQWALQLVNPVRDYAQHYAQMTIAGADDIEPGFAGSPAATRGWLNGYLANTNAPFVFNGSADGCSWHTVNARCLNGWTARDLIQLAAFAAPKRTIVLPQIYNNAMAGQWGVLAAEARHAHLPMHIVGPLTENRACGGDPSCPTMASSTAWAQLRYSLRRRHAGDDWMAMQVDLDVS